MNIILSDESEMNSRSRHLDAGLQVFSDAQAVQEASLKALNLVNFAELIQNDQDLVSLVEGLDINILYLSLKLTEEEVLAEILPYLSQEQFQQVMDREAWVDEEISLLKIKHWLSLASASQPDQLPSRFFAFEEEFQLAALNQKVVVCTQEEFESLQRGFQDKFVPLPGNEIYYAFINVSHEEEEFLNQLVMQGISLNLEYTMSLLLHAHSLPPGEQVLLATQFRRARMEEDGYLDYSESLELFKPYTLDAINREISRLTGSGTSQENLHGFSIHEALWGNQIKGDFFDLVMEEIRSRDSQSLDKRLASTLKTCQDQLIFVVNAASQVCKVEPGDLVKVKSILQGVKSLLSLGLEILSEGQISRGVGLLTSLVSLKSIFRLSHSVLHVYQKNILNSLIILLDTPVKFLKYHDAQKFGSLLCELEKAFALVFHEPIYSLLVNQFNRFPCIPASFVQEKPNFDSGSDRGKQSSDNASKFQLISRIRDVQILSKETHKALALLALARSYGYDLGVNSNLDVLSYLMSYLRETKFKRNEHHGKGARDPNMFKDLKITLQNNATWQAFSRIHLMPVMNFEEIAEEALSDLMNFLDAERELLSEHYFTSPRGAETLGKEEIR